LVAAALNGFDGEGVERIVSLFLFFIVVGTLTITE
jgi:hypothetical protein